LLQQLFQMGVACLQVRYPDGSVNQDHSLLARGPSSGDGLQVLLSASEIG
jgi:hypothetical protein